MNDQEHVARRAAMIACAEALQSSDAFYVLATQEPEPCQLLIDLELIALDHDRRTARLTYDGVLFVNDIFDGATSRVQTRIAKQRAKPIADSTTDT